MNLPKMPLVIDKIISPLIKALLPVKVRWEKYENDYPKNAILIKTWGKRFSYLILAYFLLWLVFLRPIPIKLANIEDPPYDKNGNGTPVIGINPIVMPIFSKV